MSNIGKEGGVTPPIEATVLSETEVGENAFKLINDFRGAFRQARDFQDAATQAYIGQLDYGFRIDPEHSRKVEFWRGNVYWGVEYTFTDGVHELRIDRETHTSQTESVDESISLKSKRFDYPIGRGTPPALGRLHYVNFSSFKEGKQGIVEDNNPAAIDKAQEFLNSFRHSH